MDHSAAPILDALAGYRELGRYGFTPPGHRQGRGADPRTRMTIGDDAFRSDVLATAGLDDRKSSGRYLSRAEALMADAVGAKTAFFSTCGRRRQMVQHGHRQLGAALSLAARVRSEIEELPGLHVVRDEFLGAEASRDLDPLHVVIDVSGLGINGYAAADWLREHRRIDMGLSDHRRVEATLSLADDEQTTTRLVSALTALAEGAATLPRARHVDLPSASQLELEPAMLPRDAFFAAKETVPAEKAVGRISAEQITPYPPGIPAIVPGECLTAGVLDYLRTGLAAGMQLPDPADASLHTIRVVAEH